MQLKESSPAMLVSKPRKEISQSCKEQVVELSRCTDLNNCAIVSS